MGTKKKSSSIFLRYLFVLLFLVLLDTFFISSVCLANEPLYNQSRTDTYFGKYTMKNIVEELELDEIYSGDALESLTYWANQFMTAFNTYSGDLAIQQLVIHKASNNDLQFYISNGSIGNTYDFLYIETQQIYTQMKFTYFDRWVYSGQNISYPMTKGMAGYRFKVNASEWGNVQSSSYQISSYTDSTIYLTDSVTFIPTYAVEGWTQTYGYGQYFLNHTVDVEIAPTPTPVPSATPRPSGDYTQQLDNIEYTLLETQDELHNTRVDINQGFDNLQNQISGDSAKIVATLTDEPSGDDIQFFTSGEIQEITQDYELVDPYESIWAHLIDGLYDSLLGTCEDVDIVFMGKTYHLSPIRINYPEPIANFLPLMMTVIIILTSLKFWHRIIVILQSGGALEVAHLFDNFDWSSYF